MQLALPLKAAHEGPEAFLALPQSRWDPFRERRGRGGFEKGPASSRKGAAHTQRRLPRAPGRQDMSFVVLCPDFGGPGGRNVVDFRPFA